MLWGTWDLGDSEKIGMSGVFELTSDCFPLWGDRSLTVFVYNLPFFSLIKEHSVFAPQGLSHLAL